MKLIRLSILLILLFSVQSVQCYAEEPLYTKNKYLYNREQGDIAYTQLFGFMPQPTDDPQGERSADEIVLTCMLYGINTNPLDNYRQGKSFNECLNNSSPHWTMILNDGSETMAKLENGRYSVYEIAAPTGTLKYGLNFSQVENAVSTLNTTIDDENLIIKFVRMDTFYLYRIFYINYKGAEYFIPYSYSAIPEFENGKLYEISKLYECLENRYLSYSSTKEQKNNDAKNNYFVYYIVPIFILFALILTIVIILKKRKSNTDE